MNLKSVEQVNQEILALESEVNSLKDEIKEKNKQRVAVDKERRKIEKLVGKIVIARQNILYLETNPRPEFVEAEIKRLEDTVEKIDNGYEYWYKNVCQRKLGEKEKQAFYRKENGRSEKVAQIANLRSLINY